MAHGDSRTVNLRDGKPPSSFRGPASHGALPIPRIPKLSRDFHAPVVPGYEILTELGRGGMGIVYKAIQAGLNRTVALKMVLAGLHADKDDLQRFLDEAAAVARLQHPNIVQIHEIGLAEDRPFFSMEYLDGGTLADYLQHGPPSPWVAANLVETLARAIQYAHRQGIVHRDLKPANILLSGGVVSGGVVTGDQTTEILKASEVLHTAHPKITDFGLAKHLDGTGMRTRTGIVMGTPCYMAPEQVIGRPEDIGPSIDVYGLGAILFELLTGQPPFRADSELETVRLVVEQESAIPASARPRLPRDIETICLKCLQKEPSQRYPSAAALAEDLRRFQDGEPIQARPVGPLERLGRWCKRKPVVAALSAALLMVFISGLPLVTGLWLEAKGNLGLAEERQLAAENNAQEALQQKIRANQNADEAKRLHEEVKENLKEVQARRLKEQQQMVRIKLAGGARCLEEDDWFGAGAWFTEALEREREVVAALSIDKDAAAERAGMGSHHLRLTALREHGPRLVQFWTHESAGNAVGFSAEEGWLCTTSAEGDARIWDVLSGEEISTKPMRHGALIEQASFGRLNPRGGRRLITASAKLSLHVWDTASGADVTPPEIADLKQEDGPIDEAAFSPDARRLVLRSPDHAHFLDLDKDTAVAIAVPHSRIVGLPAFSPDGRYLAVTAGNRMTRVWDTSTEKFLESEQIEQDWGDLLAVFSPDNRFLVTTAKYHVAQVWSVTPKMRTAFRVAHNGPVRAVTFRADGRWLATASSDGKALVLDLSTSNPAGPPLVHGSSVSMIQFSPDGRWLITVGEDRTVCVWDVVTGRSVIPPLKHSSPIRYVSLRPDGRHLATVSADRTVRVWDLASDATAQALRGHDDVVRLARFSPDGARIVTVSDDRTARLWDARTGKAILPNLKHPAKISHAEFSPDGRMLVTTSDKAAWMWDSSTGRAIYQPIGRHLGNNHGVSRAAFSPDGRFLLLSYVDRLNVFDLNQKKDVAQVVQPFGFEIAQMACSADGRRVCTIDNQVRVQVWDVPTNRFARHLNHGQKVHTIGFSPDSRWLVTGAGDRDAWIWNVETGEQVHTLAHGSSVFWARFSSDGSLVATVGNDGTARLWDAASGKPRATLRAGGAIVAANFSPDSRKLVTAGQDGRLWVWATDSGLPLLPPFRHHRPIVDASFSPDGKQLITASGDAVARIWQLPVIEERSIADLHLMSRLQTGHRLDRDEAGLVPVPVAELKAAWTQLNARFSSDFRVSAAQAIAWRESQALACELTLDWAAAVYHLDLLMKAEPQDPAWRQRREHAVGQLKAANRPGKDAEKAAKSKPTDG